ncbi:MAG: prepilin-type N-terminal cleavage/methylation domain-containing protein [Magnetococcales bacterium]|nr:prepilin-type N-terminal cleavage/methylation domain-containing protein [Magnetococcales bacterium]
MNTIPQPIEVQEQQEEQQIRQHRIRQAGFTLIELIMVIVILGILAAVAVPKFTDLSSEAEKAAANGVLAAVNSATATNFAAVKAGKSGVSAITSKATLEAALDGVPADWTVTWPTMTHTGKDGVTYTITVTAETGTTRATATLTP